MLTFLLSPENVPFTVALGLMLVLGLLELGSLLIGLDSSFLDNLLPDVDIDADIDVDVDVDVDAHADVHAHTISPLARALGWLGLGKVPVMMLLIVFLAAYGLMGITGQWIYSAVTGSLLPAWIAWLPVFLLTLPILRYSAIGLSKVVPKDETTAVSDRTFVGTIATITLGAARRGKPAEAKLKDKFGQTHYIMVEPDDEATFEAGSQVIIVKKDGSVFRAVLSTLERID